MNETDRIKLDIRNNINGKYSFGYAQMSANLIHFLGKYDLDVWFDTCENYLIQKVTTSNELDSLSVLDQTLRSHGENIRLHVEDANIIYSYCLGSYRIVPVILLVLGFDISLLVADNIFTKQNKYYKKVVEKINRKFNNKVTLNIFSVRDKNILIRLKKEIANGRKAFIYFDGNTGSKGNSTSNLIESFFLNQPVLFHSGVSFLEYSTNSVLRGFSLVKSSTGQYDPIYFNHDFQYRNREENIRTHCEKRTLEIAKNLEKLVPQYYNQWDTLATVHTWLNHSPPLTNNYEEGESIYNG